MIHNTFIKISNVSYNKRKKYNQSEEKSFKIYLYLPLMSVIPACAACNSKSVTLGIPNGCKTNLEINKDDNIHEQRALWNHKKTSYIENRKLGKRNSKLEKKWTNGHS